ncbi:Hypothetical predicted protein [Lecanosticta acicola]|uniref:Uncharacterized protein n=1 Tax=Lecanosticta acicola TaxID=111012 RepID=A0AAI8YVZ3_9PEZI|nr:Hypothetical predicted protein [Lecanosticta acicola]
MFRLFTIVLASAAIAAATHTVQVTVTNDRTKYHGDIWNTTVDVPTPGMSNELGLKDAKTLYVTGAKGLNVEKIVCSPFWLNNTGIMRGDNFTIEKPALAPKGSLGLHLLECMTLEQSCGEFNAAESYARTPILKPGEHGPPWPDCLKLVSVDAGKPIPCDCFNQGAFLDNYLDLDNVAQDAIHAACDYFGTATIGTDTDMVYWYHYYGQQEGYVLLHVYWHGQNGNECNTNAGNANYMDLFRSTCYDSFWGLFHNQNSTGHTNPLEDVYGCAPPDVLGMQPPGGKGGWGTDECLVWEIDPAPSVNNPEFKIGCNMDPSSSNAC